MSIQKYLLLLILSIITLATFSAAMQGYRSSAAELEAVFDQELINMANTLAALETPSLPQTVINKSQFAYQLVVNNTIVLRSNNSPDKLITSLDIGFSFANFNHQRWRTYTSTTNEKWIIVAQPNDVRISSTEQVLLAAIQPIILVIPLIAVVILFAIRKSLSPLHQLIKQLNLTSSEQLSPLEQTDSIELTPIVNTINSLFLRLSASFEREKRLAADAAHELRTPISVLSIAAHNLRVNFTNNQLSTADFDELKCSVDRMAHVVEQILTLNRITPEQFNQHVQQIDLQTVLSKVIADLYDKIQAQQQNISLLGDNAIVSGDSFYLETLFKNLIANANAYAGTGCDIIIRITTTSSQIAIDVEDNGRGIPEQALSQLFNRFYRVDTTRNQANDIGCGLGLSIAKHIVDLHHGQIKLTKAITGGLRVTVILPNGFVAQKAD